MSVCMSVSIIILSQLFLIFIIFLFFFIVYFTISSINFITWDLIFYIKIIF